MLATGAGVGTAAPRLARRRTLEHRRQRWLGCIRGEHMSRSGQHVDFRVRDCFFSTSASRWDNQVGRAMQDENRAVKLGEPWPNPAVLADRSELHPVAHPERWAGHPHVDVGPHRRSRGAIGVDDWCSSQRASGAGMFWSSTNSSATSWESRMASGPPGDVQPSVRVRTRSGRETASSWAISPPIENPTRCTGPNAAA